MKIVRVVILVLTGLLLNGCYTQLQMSKKGDKKAGGTTKHYQERLQYLSGYHYLGYSSRWGNFYYSPMSSYFGWYSWYRSPYIYNYYGFHNTSGYFFASGGQSDTDSNYGPRVIGTNRTGASSNTVQRDRDGDDNNSRVRSRASGDGNQSGNTGSRGESAERSDEDNRRLSDQIRVARSLESIQEELSTRDLPRVDLDIWTVDREIERKFGKDLSSYLKENRSGFYHKLKGYFKHENRRVRNSVYGGSGFKSSPRNTSSSVRSRSTVTRSSSSDSGSRSRSSSSSSSSRSRNSNGDGSSGSDRSRGNN